MSISGNGTFHNHPNIRSTYLKQTANISFGIVISCFVIFSLILSMVNLALRKSKSDKEQDLEFSGGEMLTV